MTATEIASLLASRAEAVADYLLPMGRREGRDWCVGSIAGEPGNSLKLTVTGSKAGVWCDFAGSPDDRGDLIGLWMRVKNTDLPTACREALDWLQVPHAVRNLRRPAAAPKPPAIRVPDERWIRLQSILCRGNISELDALARLRRLPGTAGLQLATNHGQLFFAPVFDHGALHDSWILTDGSRRNAQARKCSGALWEFGGARKPAKAKTIWGSEPQWPIGAAEVTHHDIAFVEGGPDFLAAWHLISRRGLVNRVRPVAMFGDSNAIHPDALPAFASKTVWMFAHNDPDGQGKRAAARWTDQLRKVNATVILFDMVIDGVKDLNELVTAEEAEA